MSTNDVLAEDAAKRFKEKTGVELKGPYIRTIRRYLEKGQVNRDLKRWMLFDGEEEKKEAFMGWVEELVKTKTIPQIPLVLLKPPPFNVSATPFVPRGPAAKSATASPADFSAGSTGLFGATSSPFTEDKVPMCEKGLCCTDILCTKSHPQTHNTEVTLPQI